MVGLYHGPHDSSVAVAIHGQLVLGRPPSTGGGGGGAAHIMRAEDDGRPAGAFPLAMVFGQPCFGWVHYGAGLGRRRPVPEHGVPAMGPPLPVGHLLSLRCPCRVRFRSHCARVCCGTNSSEFQASLPLGLLLLRGPNPWGESSQQLENLWHRAPFLKRQEQMDNNTFLRFLLFRKFTILFSQKIMQRRVLF